MSPRRGQGPLILAALVLAPVLAACGGPSEQTIAIRMRYSRFLPAAITVTAGRALRFEVANDDPLAHEIVFGDEATQQRHESGTERTHDGQPGQASLEAGERQLIEYTFERPGTYVYGCHRPGHYAYGMRGVVHVK